MIAVLRKLPSDATLVVSDMVISPLLRRDVGWRCRRVKI